MHACMVSHIMVKEVDVVEVDVVNVELSMKPDICIPHLPGYGLH